MSSSDNNKLIATAVGAAVAGAAVAVAAMKLSERKREPISPRHIYNPKTTYVFDDNLEDVEGIVLPHNHEEKMRRRIAARVAVEEDNMTPRRSVTVRVPATSANVGPGCKYLYCEVCGGGGKGAFLFLYSFTRSCVDDCVGMAVDLWSEVTVERADKFEIIAKGEGAEQMPKDDTNYLVVGVKAALEPAKKPVPILKYYIDCKIPYARGLGSSSAAIVAGIIAGLVLAGHRLPCWGSEALLQIAAGIEVSA